MYGWKRILVALVKHSRLIDAGETGRKMSNTIDPAGIPVIRPTAVYRPEQIRAILGLKDNTIPREIRMGRLRVAKRGGKHFVLGCWLVEWLSNAEVKRKPRFAPNVNGQQTLTH
jgi:hypothetical protein